MSTSNSSASEIGKSLVILNQIILSSPLGTLVYIRISMKIEF